MIAPANMPEGVPAETSNVEVVDARQQPLVELTDLRAFPGLPESRVDAREGFVNRVRLPDGRIVRSDNLTGDSMSVGDACTLCGPVVCVGQILEIVVPQKLASGTIAKPLPLGFRRSGKGLTQTASKRARLREVMAAQPNCPECGERLVIAVAGRRMANRRTACFDPSGRVICAACRSIQANELAEAERQKRNPTPGPVLTFFRS